MRELIKVYFLRTLHRFSSLLASIMDGASLQYVMDASAFELDDYFRTAHDMVLRMISL